MDSKHPNPTGRPWWKLLAGSLVVTGCLWQTGVMQLGAATFIPPPIPNARAKLRGCRTGGPFGINKISPSWVSVEARDTPRVAEGIVRESHTATNDNPAFHISHDWNADVVLDPAYNGLNSDGNPIEDGERRIEIEWETAFFPPRFWPSPGDRAWMLGRWIFDCGHPDPYRTEIHPPKAVAFTHFEPIIFPGDQRPSPSNVTTIYLHGRGGYYKRPVVGRNYVFDVPLPPRPRLSTLRTAVLSLPFGGPRPTFQFVPNSNPPKLRVTYPLVGVSDPLNTRRFGAVIASAWQSIAINPAGPGYRLLRVTFDSIKINNDHDPVFSGEWRLWIRAGSQWFEVKGLGDVDGGETVQIGRSVQFIVPDNGSFDIQTSGWEDDCDGRFRKKDSDIRLWSASIADLRCEIDGNDSIGILEQSYNSGNNYGIGAHNDPSVRNGDADTNGDFNLRYRVQQIRYFPGRVIINDPVINNGPLINNDSQ